MASILGDFCTIQVLTNLFFSIMRFLRENSKNFKAKVKNRRLSSNYILEFKSSVRLLNNRKIVFSIQTLTIHKNS